MEILAASPIMALGAVTGITLVTTIILGIIFGFFCYIDNDIGACISGICVTISFILLLVSIAYFQEPSGNYKYTVEITEESKYKELVEKEYKFKRLYDGKEIYEISGAPLEEIEK